MDKRFENAKSEFEIENDDCRHKLVYAHFGLAIYYGQCLEETFSIMIWADRIIKKNVQTNQEVNEIIDSIENSKKTMGNFINEVKQIYSLPTSIVEQLDNILQIRNYLAHKYFKQHIGKFYSETGQLEMIKYFCDFIDDSNFLDEKLKSYYSAYITKFGITDNRIEELMIEIKNQEIKRTSK